MLWLWLTVIAAGIVASGFYSGCETGLYCLNRIRMQIAARQGRRPAILLSRMLRDREGIISTTLAGTNLSNYLATVCMVSILTAMHMDEARAELVTALALTPVLFVLAEVTPKNLFRREADTLMYRLARPLWASDRLFRATGVIALFKGLARLAARCVGIEKRASLLSLEPRQQIAAMLREGVGAGVLTDVQSAMVDRIMRLSGVPARSAMIKRNDVEAVSVDISREAFVEQVRRHDYTRMPVLDGPDRVVGVVCVFDVLAEDMPEGQPAGPITAFLSPPVYIKADQSIMSALTTMQQHGVPMAVVTDVQRRFLGIVTVKDLVEEIVGELETW